MCSQPGWKLWSLVIVLTVALCGCPSGDKSSSKGRSSGGGNKSSSKSTDGGKSDGSEVSTEGWGNLKGKFIVVGAPEPAKVKVTADPQYCGKYDLVDESVVAGPNGELANVILLPYVKRGDQPPTPHESYAADADATVLLNNLHCRFEPHVATLRTSQTLDIKNSDTVGHNTKIDVKSPNTAFNSIIPPGDTKDVKMEAAERLPVHVSCSIHPWMKAYLVVTDTPYVGVTGKDGEFEIKDLPAGKHTFIVWQEKAGYLSDVEVDGKATKWTRGRVEVVIKDKETTDLGEVKVKYEDMTGS